MAVFVAVGNQWRVGGFGEPYAIDYNVIPIVAKTEFNSPEWPEILKDLQIMEYAALEFMREQK